MMKILLMLLVASAMHKASAQDSLQEKLATTLVRLQRVLQRLNTKDVNSCLLLNKFPLCDVSKNSTVTDNCTVVLSGGAYLFQTYKKVHFAVALQECKKLGMEVVTFETVEEAAAVNDYSAKINAKRPADFYYWTSATSFGKRKTYRWRGDGPEVQKELWQKGDPNDAKGAMMEERCVTISRSRNYFRSDRVALCDNSCEPIKAYAVGLICEQP